MSDVFKLRDSENRGDNMEMMNKEYKSRVTALGDEIDRLNGYLLERGSELE
jgi:hypothetical protein